MGKKVVVDAGDSENLAAGQIVTARKLRDENSALKRRDLKLVQVRDAVPATSTQILQESNKNGVRLCSSWHWMRVPVVPVLHMNRTASEQ